MRNKRRVWVLLLLVAICGSALWGIAYFRSRAFERPAALLKRLPTRNAVVLSIDFASLRRAGILRLLAGSKVAEESEYRLFVKKTAFDYTRDLDSALVSFAPEGKFFLLKGRFDWASLRTYVKEQGGRCDDAFCRMAGSAPQRKISFFPLRSNLMALAVSLDDSAANRLKLSEAGPGKVDVPNDPIWIFIPSSLLKTTTYLPEGTRMFTRSMENSESITLGLGPRAQDFAAKLVVRCRSEQDAAALAEQLERATALLRDMFARQNQAPNPRDLSGVLTAGAFRYEDSRVLGYWPIQRVFLEELAGGSS